MLKDYSQMRLNCHNVRPWALESFKFSLSQMTKSSCRCKLNGGNNQNGFCLTWLTTCSLRIWRGVRFSSSISRSNACGLHTIIADDEHIYSTPPVITSSIVSLGQVEQSNHAIRPVQGFCLAMPCKYTLYFTQHSLVVIILADFTTIWCMPDLKLHFHRAVCLLELPHSAHPHSLQMRRTNKELKINFNLKQIAGFSCYVEASDEGSAKKTYFATCHPPKSYTVLCYPQL